MLHDYIGKLIRHQDLTEAEALQAMDLIMTGQATQAQIGGYLIALRMKGETADEIAGSARALRRQASAVTVRRCGALLDTAGTGGDGQHTFNISTAAAFVIAGAGRKVAKHGNRAASSRSGSADVLAALGVDLDLSPAQVGQCIDEIGIGFLYAPKFHPAMKHAIGPRKELGQRTIFNILGPLTNPARATHQIIGVYDPALTQVMAEVLGSLGSQAALVIHGYGGVDELTTGGPNRVSQLRNGRVTTFELDAGNGHHGKVEPGLHFRRCSVQELRGGDPPENARMLRAILSGQDRGPRRDVVLLNAASALAVEGSDLSSNPYAALRAAADEASASVDSGAALRKLDMLIEMSQELGSSGHAAGPDAVASPSFASRPGNGRSQ